MVGNYYDERAPLRRCAASRSLASVSLGRAEVVAAWLPPAGFAVSGGVAAAGAEFPLAVDGRGPVTSCRSLAALAFAVSSAEITPAGAPARSICSAPSASAR